MEDAAGLIRSAVLRKLGTCWIFLGSLCRMIFYSPCFLFLLAPLTKATRLGASGSGRGSDSPTMDPVPTRTFGRRKQLASTRAPYLVVICSFVKVSIDFNVFVHSKVNHGTWDPNSCWPGEGKKVYLNMGGVGVWVGSALLPYLVPCLWFYFTNNTKPSNINTKPRVILLFGKR